MSRREEQHVDEEGYCTPNLPSFLQTSCAGRGLPAASRGARKAVGLLLVTNNKFRAAREDGDGLRPVGAAAGWPREDSPPRQAARGRLWPLFCLAPAFSSKV